MKNKYAWLTILSTLFGSIQLFAQPTVTQADVVVTGINLRTGSAVVLQKVIISPTTAGTAVVRFDGTCIADSADRIVLAASNDADWHIADGCLSIQVANAASGRRSFSHTRVYDIPAGKDTFFAVGQNYVETGGSGLASIYGSLTVEFFPAGDPAFVVDSNIYWSGAVRPTTASFQDVPLVAPVSGKVLAHMDGIVYSDPGDQIMLSAYYQPTWLVGAGSVGLMAANGAKRYSPFTHSRMFSVSNNSYTYYASGKNVLNVSGSGNASVYGNLSAEFFPNGGTTLIDATGFQTPTLNIRAQAMVLDSVTINPTVAGKALVQFDGYCTSSAGDRIVFAASNDHNWHPTQGCVTVSAISNTNTMSVFSHSRLYTVAPGSNTFYAVTQNYVDVAGSGQATVYANLSVKFYANANTSVANVEPDAAFQLYPNPAQNELFVVLNNAAAKNTDLEILDLNGRIINRIQAGTAEQLQIDISQYAAGIYLIRNNGQVQKFVKE